MQTETTVETKLFMWGSAECDQFLALDEDGEEMSEIVKPYYIDYFNKNNIIVIAICCGGMHTLYLTNLGNVYSQGCDDDGVLGRTLGDSDPRQPGLVKLPMPVNMISCGDAHSIAANSNGRVYYWGFYRNTNGPMGEKVKEPREIGHFNGEIQKVLSGNNHTLILSQGKVYTCGDADTNVLGRLSKTRNKIAQSLKFQPLGERNIVDVYCGGNAAFIKRQKKDKFDYYAWGLNNYGQLGLGHTENTFIPTQITAFNNQNIINIVGGEHHTIALNAEGELYAFGRNDDGQLGLGKEINEQLRVEALKEKQNQKQDQKQKRKSKKNESALMEKQETDKVFGYEFVTSPMKLEKISKVAQVCAGQFSSFAYTSDNILYAWGLGQNYVLATRKEDSVYEPKEVSIAKGQKVLLIALGGQHAAALTSEKMDYSLPSVDVNLLAIKSKGLKNDLKEDQEELVKVIVN